MLKKKYQTPIHSIYAFVRYADEIVDTLDAFDKETLLADFIQQTFRSIDQGISTNPILQSFQWVVNNYQIDRDLIKSFFNSMYMDLHKNNYNETDYKTYINGSAEVVGLMCLKVFYKNEPEEYARLSPSARVLGQAYQKINFLRDINADYLEKHRTYFPEVDFTRFSEQEKAKIENEISRDFAVAFEGISKLKKEVRTGVYLTYLYYTRLFRKISKTPVEKLIKTRYRISNSYKVYLLLLAIVRNYSNKLIP